MSRLAQIFNYKIGYGFIGVVLLLSVIAINARTQPTGDDHVEKNRKALYKVITHNAVINPKARAISKFTEIEMSTGLEKKIFELKNQGYEVNQLSSCVYKNAILYTVIMKKPI